MASLHPAKTAGAAADGDLEMTMDWPARNLRLILLIDVRGDNIPAATRATIAHPTLSRKEAKGGTGVSLPIFSTARFKLMLGRRNAVD